MDNKIESMLLEILKNQDKMLKAQETIQLDISEIKSTVNAIFDQTADLSEFRTENKDGIASIRKDIRFLKNKLHETEEDVFDIKDHLKIIK